jgi:hypothetical protein
MVASGVEDQGHGPRILQSDMRCAKREPICSTAIYIGRLHAVMKGSPPTAMSCRTLILPQAALQDRAAPGTNSNVTPNEVMSGCASEPVAAHLERSNPTAQFRSVRSLNNLHAGIEANQNDLGSSLAITAAPLAPRRRRACNLTAE